MNEGLKSLRAKDPKTGATRTKRTKCENCGCERYNPCTCTKKQTKKGA